MSSERRKFYPRQVWMRYWRRINRLAKRYRAHELEIPPGYELKSGEEITVKYEDGKFRVIP